MEVFLAGLKIGGSFGVWEEFLWVGFYKGVLLGYFRVSFLGQINGCELRSSDGVSLGTF